MVGRQVEDLAQCRFARGPQHHRTPQKPKVAEERKPSNQVVQAQTGDDALRGAKLQEKTAKSDASPAQGLRAVVGSAPAAPPAKQVPPAGQPLPPPATVREARPQSQERAKEPAPARRTAVAAADAIPGVVEAPGERRDAPDLLEDQASSARRRGVYASAADLYRSASTLRKQSGDDARAAWDLAHAVECLAAGSQVANALSLREELRRSFPNHAGPQSAANAALRYAAPPEPATVK